MGKPRIVIFDLDETLTKKGTWGRFVLGAIQNLPHKWLPFFAASLFSQAKYMLGVGPRERVKETMMRWTLAGRSRQDLAQMAQIFADDEIAQGLRVRAKEVLAGHQKAGERIIIASAAVDLIVMPIAKHLNILETVCTKMAYDENDRLQPKLGGPNCYGANKLRMVEAHLGQDPDFNRADYHITMYSDSSSDLDIMRWADIAIAVNPSPRLAKCVSEFGFDVQNWDQR